MSISTSKTGIKMKWKFDKIDNLNDEGRMSECFKFDENVEWKIGVSTSLANNQKSIDIFLYFVGNQKEKKTWICKTEKQFKLYNQNGMKKDLKFKLESIYDCENLVWGFENFENWENLKNGGFIKDNSIVVEVLMDFEIFDFSKNSDNFTDIKIKCENSDFYLNKGVLSSQSGYFYKMFVEQNNDLKSLKLEMKAAEFRNYQAQIIKKEEIGKMIEFAEHYENPELHKKCEDFLMKNDIEIIEKLKFAEKYEYSKLMKSCIDSLKNKDEIRDLHKKSGFRYLNASTLHSIMTKALEFD